MEYKNINWLIENADRIIIHEDSEEIAEKTGKLIGSKTKYFNFRWGMWGTWLSPSPYTPFKSVYVYRGAGAIEFAIPGHNNIGNPPKGIPTKDVNEFQKECLALEKDENMMNAIKCMAIL